MADDKIDRYVDAVADYLVRFGGMSKHDSWLAIGHNTEHLARSWAAWEPPSTCAQRLMTEPFLVQEYLH